MQDNVCKLIELKNSKEWISFEKYYMNYNVFSQFDFFRLEDIHTNVLKSLLIQDNVYGLYTYPLEKLIEAIIQYGKDTNDRRVTYEYILLAGINDSDEQANQLADLIAPTYGYINLIPYNEVDENGFKRSSNNRIHKFHDILLKRGIKATIRKEFGSDIDAACGQLRARYEKKS